MFKCILAILFTAFSICFLCDAWANTGAADADSVKLTSKDLSTADGSCRVGLHGGKLYCILTGTAVDIQLVPNIWSNNEESQKWNAWLVAFDDALFSRWLDSDPGDGQETVELHIVPATITQIKGQFLAGSKSGADGSAKDQLKFESAVQKSLDQTLKAAGPMPCTKYPLKEVRLSLTFMHDANAVPNYGKRDFGFVATKVPVSEKLVVCGRLKDGRSPGIQIMSEGDGSIQMMELDDFLEKCDEIASQAAR